MSTDLPGSQFGGAGWRMIVDNLCRRHAVRARASAMMEHVSAASLFIALLRAPIDVEIEYYALLSTHVNQELSLI